MNKFDSYTKYGIKILSRKNIREFTELQFSGIMNSNIGTSLNFVDYRNSRVEGLKHKN